MQSYLFVTLSCDHVLCLGPLPDISHSAVSSTDGKQTDFPEYAAFTQCDQYFIISQSAHHLNLARLDNVHLFANFSLLKTDDKYPLNSMSALDIIRQSSNLLADQVSRQEEDGLQFKHQVADQSGIAVLEQLHFRECLNVDV